MALKTSAGVAVGGGCGAKQMMRVIHEALDETSGGLWSDFTPHNCSFIIKGVKCSAQSDSLHSRSRTVMQIAHIEMDNEHRTVTIRATMLIGAQDAEIEALSSRTVGPVNRQLLVVRQCFDNPGVLRRLSGLFLIPEAAQL